MKGLAVRGLARKFWRNPASRRKAVVAAVLTLAQARIILRFASLKYLQNWARRRGAGRLAQADAVWAMQHAFRLAPATTCLCKAVALQRLLSRNGHASDLRIGVRLAGAEFSAHAWLEANGQILVGAEEAANHRLLTQW